ncbi:hypothetical protein [Cyanobium sp. NS01]|uniref:hypothetical protein n=1 Tax=Cyanobium sp. NS01 TaxID=261284 RepID=UPI001648B92C|nr:hypothetical protein [Cyanobium sp. NS01]QNI70972.1 putative membrane protein [Cyanobium sp. NS01]
MPPSTSPAQAPAAGSPLELPDLVYPPLPWGFQKAAPKTSLSPALARTARPLVLNLVELIHWASFPLGFWILAYIFVHADVIATHVDGDLMRVFWLQLGMACQVFGGGISGILMHEYEGWQITPFRNILGLQQNAPSQDVAQVLVPNFNNAWLRAVAYQMLFSFQTAGLGFFSLGVFGAQPVPLLLVFGGIAIALLGPSEPRTRFFRVVDGEARPVLPLSWSLLIVFALNALANLIACHHFFGPTIAEAWPPTLLPWLAAVVPAWLVPWLALLAPLTVAAGGAYEGWVAESSFNQWQHFIAFVLLTLGLGLYGLFYWHMVNVGVH